MDINTDYKPSGRDSTRGGRRPGQQQPGGGGNRRFQRGGRGRGRFQGRHYRGRGRGGRNIPNITPQDWSTMSYKEQQSVLDERGTRCQISAITWDTADLQSTVSHITNPPIPTAIANIAQVNTNNQANASQVSAAFGGRAAYFVS